MRIVLSIFILMLVVSSCKKAEKRSCFKGTGAMDSLDVQVEPYFELNLGQRLNYILVKDTINFIRIKGGRNLLRSVNVEVVNDVLFIENGNRCNFLRNMGEIMDIEIHFTTINRIEGRISHNISSTDTISGDFFNLKIAGASGNANLLVNTNFLNGFINDGNADYLLSGHTKYAHIQAHSNGFADVRGLQVQEQLEITSRSNRAIYCSADGIPLVINLEATGNVYYTGEPSSIELNKTGSGKLEKLD